MSTTNFGITADQRGNPSVSRFRMQALAIMQSLRVCLPGIVQAFDADTQTVDVQIATNEYTWNNLPPTPSALDLQTTADRLPLLSGIPIFIANGGGLNLTFPIQKGDECLVVFADTPLSVWVQNGGLDNLPIDQRRHSLSDGVAMFGVRSQPRVLADYSTDSAQLRTDDGQTLVEVKDGQITIKADTVTVNATNCTIAATSQLTISSHTHIDGKVFLTHTHSGVQSGGSNTGPVV